MAIIEDFHWILLFHQLATASSESENVVHVAEKTGMDIKWQIKWLCLSMIFLGPLKYT